MRFPWIFALLICLGFSGCGKKPTPEEAATAFLQRLAAGEFRQAYDEATFGVRAQQKFMVFERNMKSSGMEPFTEAEWQAVNIQDRSAKLQGEVDLKSGAKLGVRLELLREAGQWRVLAFRTRQPKAEGFSMNLAGSIGREPALLAAADRPMPDERAIRKLVQDTLTDFDAAIRAKDFESFYNTISALWQSQVTVGQMNRAFGHFIEKDVHLEEFLKSKAEFKPAPFINGDGLLVVSGTYPAGKYEAAFSLRYIYELPRWRLFGVDVNVITADKNAAPDVAK